MIFDIFFFIVETVLLVAFWSVAISGFWNGVFLWSGFATGIVACSMAVILTVIVVGICREVWYERH